MHKYPESGIYLLQLVLKKNLWPFWTMIITIFYSTNIKKSCLSVVSKSYCELRLDPRIPPPPPPTIIHAWQQNSVPFLRLMLISSLTSTWNSSFLSVHLDSSLHHKLANAFLSSRSHTEPRGRKGISFSKSIYFLNWFKLFFALFMSLKIKNSKWHK